MPTEYTYDYAIVRIVPRVERGERINVGVILSCVDETFLDCRWNWIRTRLRLLDPALDVEASAPAWRPFRWCARAGPRRVRSAICRRVAASGGWSRRAAP